jgi:outer membrane autotransporter protein
LTRTPFDVLPGLTRNQRAVGSGLEQGYKSALGSGAGADFYSILLLAPISAGAIAAAYDAIGGEGVTGSQQTTFSAASRFVEAMREQGAFWLSTSFGAVDPGANRSFQLGNGRVWVNASGSGGRLGSDRALGAASLSAHSWGGAAGLETTPIPNLLVGIAGGGSGSSFSVSQRSTSGSVDGGQLGVYAVGRWNGFYASDAFAWGHYGVETTRTVSAFGLTGTSGGSFDASVLTGRIEAGHIAELGFVNAAPFVAVEPSRINQPGFSETASRSDSPLLSLSFAGKTITSVPTALGLQFDRIAVLEGGWTLAPHLRAAWLHEWNTTRNITALVPAAPGTVFSLAGTPAARNAARLIGTLQLVQAGTAAFYANVAADLSPHGQAISGNIGVKLSW